ncbi:STAS domain-containing protein [Andreprevotia chitinilytica]|uniref:STAS domain-containing protein n=1 Tax=Andreprevotia chitinilytica TaxID=396808 RepID=UPI0012EB2F6A|nr:STAS domain-containing protein [Andreprevotia chitinilytica]
MAFSLFRKKDSEPVKPLSPGSSAASTSSIATPSDFPATPAQPAPRPAAQTPAEQHGETTSYNLSELTIEVEESSSQLTPAEEEAVVLYANGRLAAAIDSLKAAMPSFKGSRQTGPWQLMFDLLQIAGNHTAFDELGLQYVVEFETSPPLWRDMKSAPTTKPQAATGLVTLPSSLVGDAANAEIQKILKACERGGPVRLDFSRVTDIDGMAAAELLALWPRARKLGAQLQGLGVDSVTKMLSGKIESGRRHPAEAPYWLLLMEITQTSGEQEAFENLAIDYAVTFEVSPPSWDPKLVAKAPQAPAAQKAAEKSGEPVTDRLELAGDLVGGAADALAKIRAFAATHSKPVLDFSGVLRVDFDTAGQMLNLGVELMQAGKMPTILGANEPVAGLFKLMGVADLMTLVKR